jgi:hypothetical protein
MTPAWLEGLGLERIADDLDMYNHPSSGATVHFDTDENCLTFFVSASNGVQVQYKYGLSWDCAGHWSSPERSRPFFAAGLLACDIADAYNAHRAQEGG